MNNYKRINVLMVLLMMFSTTLLSQIKAVTELGDTIFVFNNGTWSFSEEEPLNELNYLSEKLTIDTIDTPFNFNKSAKKDANSTSKFFKIKYDDKAWKRIPPGELDNKEAEMAFKFIDSDIYCLVINEEVEIGSENILKIALNSMMERTGGKVELIKAEQRTVNGQPVLRGIYQMDLSGMVLKFDSYFYSDVNGTIQFITWTGANIWEKHNKEIETFLNGLMILNDKE